MYLCVIAAAGFIAGFEIGRARHWEALRVLQSTIMTLVIPATFMWWLAGIPTMEGIAGHFGLMSSSVFVGLVIAEIIPDEKRRRKK